MDLIYITNLLLNPLGNMQGKVTGRVLLCALKSDCAGTSIPTGTWNCHLSPVVPVGVGDGPSLAQGHHCPSYTFLMPSENDRIIEPWNH